MQHTSDRAYFFPKGGRRGEWGGESLSHLDVPLPKNSFGAGNLPNNGCDEDVDLFEASLCESGTLEVLHRTDLVCKLLTLETNVLHQLASSTPSSSSTSLSLLTSP